MKYTDKMPIPHLLDNYSAIADPVDLVKDSSIIM